MVYSRSVWNGKWLLLVKDSKKYPLTGGWGFAQFTNGKPDGEAVHQTCFSCHEPAKDRDFVFTRYAP
ncbi:MAG TPA: cytochrome P460 family protein [Pyrinomonadaceae bacterium]|nr:cytochrome P460 family protein [Pyrinomonadaceae bacterium]